LPPFFLVSLALISFWVTHKIDSMYILILGHFVENRKKFKAG